MTLTYEKVRVDCAVKLKTLLELDVVIEANTHGRLEAVGIVDEKTAFTELEGRLEGGEITVWSYSEEGARDEEPVFRGLIREANIWEKQGLYMVRIRALTGTWALDVKIKSRSFQDVEMSYAEVVKEALKDTPGAAAICTIGKDRKIEKPLIQYRETDWEFIKRIASHMNGGVVPDCRTSKAWFWFGAPEGGEQREFSELCYEAHTDGQYFAS